MASEDRTREILQGLHEAVVAFDEDKTAELCRAVLAEGIDPYSAVMEGMSSGMAEAGGRYEKMEYFVPELLLCSDALYAGLDILRPAITESGGQTRSKGSIVIGVVEGDIHDIGKSLVKIMFEAAGWTVYDLGRDVKLEKFVEEQARTDAEIVAISALMTTSMLAMPKVIGMLKERNSKVRIMVGGAPLNPDIAKKYGADGYAPSAGTAVEEATRLVQELRKEAAN